MHYSIQVTIWYCTGSSIASATRVFITDSGEIGGTIVKIDESDIPTGRKVKTFSAGFTSSDGCTAESVFFPMIHQSFASSITTILIIVLSFRVSSFQTKYLQGMRLYRQPPPTSVMVTDSCTFIPHQRTPSCHSKRGEEDANTTLPCHTILTFTMNPFSALLQCLSLSHDLLLKLSP